MKFSEFDRLMDYWWLRGTISLMYTAMFLLFQVASVGNAVQMNYRESIKCIWVAWFVVLLLAAQLKFFDFTDWLFGRRAAVVLAEGDEEG